MQYQDWGPKVTLKMEQLIKIYLFLFSEKDNKSVIESLRPRGEEGDRCSTKTWADDSFLSLYGAIVVSPSALRPPVNHIRRKFDSSYNERSVLIWIWEFFVWHSFFGPNKWWRMS